jgi:heme exporter protein D
MAHHAKQVACANCPHVFLPDSPAEICPKCGQHNHAHSSRSGPMPGVEPGSTISIGRKVVGTFGLLLFKPGELTKHFLAGHRAAYVQPVWLYVFISLIFFLALALQSSNRGSRLLLEEVAENRKRADTVGQANHVQVLPGVIMDNPSDTAALHRLARQLREPARRGDRQAAAKLAALATVEQVLADQQSGKKRKRRYPDSGARIFLFGFDIDKINFARLHARLSPAQADSVIRSVGGKPTAFSQLAVRWSARGHHITREEVGYQVLRGIAVAMFLLLPLTALLLKGAYFRQHRPYRSHLVFSAHLHSFAFLLLMLGSLFVWVPRLSELLSLLPLLGGIYFVGALRTVYGQPLERTLLTATLLSLTYVLMLSFSLVAVAATGALLF